MLRAGAAHAGRQALLIVRCIALCCVLGAGCPQLTASAAALNMSCQVGTFELSAITFISGCMPPTHNHTLSLRALCLSPCRPCVYRLYEGGCRMCCAGMS